MKLAYDAQLKIAGIGLVPWTRLGPEKWLRKYAVASLYGADLPASCPVSYDLVSYIGHDPVLEKHNSQHLLQHPDFQKLLNTYLPGYALMTYKPIVIPEALQDRAFLMVDPAFTQTFENKVFFREMMHDDVVFPSYEIIERASLDRTPKGFEAIARGRDSFVLQDEQLSGGKGTFVIGNYTAYVAALDALGRMSDKPMVVVSDRIAQPVEFSIQACVTKYGVFTGPLQRQIVAEPLLANMQVADGDKFCGAQIDVNEQNTAVHTQAQSMATIIGNKLQEKGYKGIFGVDFLQDAAGKLFVLEVNPRITGVTPLVTALFDDESSVPFYLLHILELGGYDYTIAAQMIDYTENGSILILHSRSNQPVTIVNNLKSGTYTQTRDGLVRVRPSINVQEARDNEFIVEEYMPHGVVIKPGGRLLMVQFPGLVIDSKTTKLKKQIQDVVNELYESIALKPYNGNRKGRI